MRQNGLTEAGYRKELFGTMLKDKEVPIFFMSRLERLFENWLNTTNTPRTFEGLKKLILREEFYKRCHTDLKAYLREKQNIELTAVSTSAQRYLDAYGGTVSSKMEVVLHPDNVYEKGHDKDMQYQGMSVDDNRKKNEKNVTKAKICFKCGSKNHLVKDCVNEYNHSKPSNDASELRICNICRKSGHCEKNCWYKDLKKGERLCFRCGSRNHLVRDCSKPRKIDGKHNAKETRIQSPIVPACTSGDKYETTRDVT
jgi:hypothetical protein